MKTLAAVAVFIVGMCFVAWLVVEVAQYVGF